MIFHFASFVVNEKNCTLSNHQQSIEIEPKIFSLLCFLCKNAQRAISRDELIEKVWQGRIVSNAAINRAVGELRKIIEVDVKDPQYIVTISKVGYRFNATIIQADSRQIIDNNITTPLTKSTKNHLTLPLSLLLFAVILVTWLIYTNEKVHVASKYQFDISPPTPLTTIKGSAFKQQVSANQQTVFLHRDANNRNVQLWLQPHNLPALKLTDDKFYYTYAIFKDADTLFATRFDNLTARNCQIIKLAISTKQIDKITDCAKRAVTYLAFDGDSRKLYFNYRDSVSQPFAIRSLQLDTGRIQQLTHANPKGNTRGDYLFSLSPSNKKMAIFEYQQDGTAMLKVTDINNPTEVSRYKSYDRVSGISWFNEKTLLISDKSGVVSYDLANAESENIIQGDNITQATFSSDLSLLTYVKFDVTRNIYQQSTSAQPPEKAITHSAYTNFFPSYANTSNSLAYFSTDSGTVDVQLIDQTGTVTKLNFPEAIKHVSNLIWARDDSAIFASINSKLFLYSIDKHQWREIKTDLKSIHHVEIINNQEAIVSSDDSGDWQLWQVNLSTQTAKQLTKNGGYSSSYIADRDTLLLSKYSQAGLFELNLNDLSETTIKADFKITDWNKWQVRGDNIYLWENKNIISLNIYSKIKATHWQLDETNPLHFSINFDASKVAYSVTEQERSTIWKSTVLQEPKSSGK